MKRACAAVLCLVLASCVPPGSTGTGGGGGAVAMQINNRPITTEQLLSSPFLRESLRNLIFFETMVATAQEAGVTIDEKEIDKTFEEQKAQYSMGDAQGWQDFLSQNMSTEEEFKNQIRSSMYFEGLIKKKVNVTEDDIKKSWDTDANIIRDVHAQQNAIPEAEKAALTFEQVKETIKLRLESMKGMEAQEQVMQDIITKASVKISGISDKTKAQLLEDLILNNEKKRLEETMKEREETKKKMEAEQAAAAGGAPAGGAEGGAVAPPAGEAAETK
ncbi:SurA N-terminal domain-containing protein [bacterium]|nr:SurA N-terminal domain-containing protein [bacterium]